MSVGWCQEAHLLVQAAILKSSSNASCNKLSIGVAGLKFQNNQEGFRHQVHTHRGGVGQMYMVQVCGVGWVVGTSMRGGGWLGGWRMHRRGEWPKTCKNQPFWSKISRFPSINTHVGVLSAVVTVSDAFRNS